jgi:hypothetical protein
MVVLILSACSDDSVFEGVSENTDRDTRIADALDRLDSRNYDAVISELSLIYTTTAIDPQVYRILASAYMGKAGLDLTLYMDRFDETEHPFDLMAYMISSTYVSEEDGQRYLDGNAVDGRTENGEEAFEVDLLENLSSAKRMLTALEDAGLASADDIIQLGYACAAHFIMNVGNQTAISLNDTLRYGSKDSWRYGIVPVPINTGAYHYYKTSQSTDFKYRWSSLTSPSYYAEEVSAGGRTSFQDDLEHVRRALDAFTQAYPSSGMKGPVESFLRSALGVQEGVEITSGMILEYNSTGIYSFVNRLADGQ